MRGEEGKETPKIEMDNRCIFMTSYMTLPKINTFGDVKKNVGLYFFSRSKCTNIPTFTDNQPFDCTTNVWNPISA